MADLNWFDILLRMWLIWSVSSIVVSLWRIADALSIKKGDTINKSNSVVGAIERLRQDISER